VKAWAAHAMFAAILLGSLAAQVPAAGDPDDTATLFEPAILRVARSHGLGLREYKTTAGLMSPTLLFEAPGCSQPLQVSLHLWTFEEETLTEDAPQQRAIRRYVYLDRTWDAPDRLAVFVQRMKYRALAMFGLTEYVPSQYFLLLEAPADCRSAEDIDWRSVWNRNYIAAAQAGRGPTSK
jgi:hypothetical protein